MVSLRELVSRHDALLVLDSASAVVQVSLYTRAAQPRHWQAEDEAGVAVFAGTDAVLKAAGLSLSDVQAYAFCDGPGSVLGIRTAAVALRTWRVVKSVPCYAYGSLALAAHSQLVAGAAAPFSVVADARRDLWHRVQVDASGNVGPLHRVAADGLSGTLLTPASFRHWAPLPAGTRTVPYSLGELFTAAENVALFEETAAPDAFLHEEPVYQTWTPQVHRAPT